VTDRPPFALRPGTPRQGGLFRRAARALLQLLRFLAGKSGREYFDPAEFLQFCAVGFVNTLLDFCVYLLATRFLPLYASRTLSWAAACLFSYMLNKSWVFHSRTKHGTSGFRFVVVNLIGLLFGISALEALAHFGLGSVSAYVLTLPVIALGNYFGYKLWSFKEG
jgi:putative flippase GtrA